MEKILIIVNMQEDYVGVNRNMSMFSYNTQLLLKNINARIAAYPPEAVVYIRDVNKKNIFSRLVADYVIEGSEGSELVKGLKIVSDNIYTKYKGNAFTNMELYNYIETNKVNNPEIIGIDSGSDLADTALAASEIGYKVEINRKCTATVMQKRADIMESALKGSGVKFI